ncbi:MAG: polysaccharide pyruvyl transferase family protein [Microbacterium ginsengisoli]|uniref:polysaccharide pyruvyl transferase family protein n=1 Tax=Microbacterium TaxID=33882 RepID=UPI001ACFE43D|nr:polysaccharide pyruvyl transferase family protein [Microbacterium sp. 71-23]MBN9198645.1 polysaccharide pyruvyl transferase family protein [Microbacterium ginsengisoli]
MTVQLHSGRFAMYSATRQWNPGDEFILAGTRRIIDAAFGPLDPVLYDRNPDVRPADGTTIGARNLRRPLDETAGALYERLSAHLRLGFSSNSVKFDSDLSSVSLALMAGSPEWASDRCWSFYDHVFRHRIPVIGLGLGSMPEERPEFVDVALGKAVALTTRSRSLARTPLARRFDIEYLPCPALLSAPTTREVTSVTRVGIAIGVPYEDAVWANGLDTAFYEQVCAAIDDLIAAYGSEVAIEFVAHYIDEIPVLRERFPDHVVRYSFDSADYADLFGAYDLVISTRVHGCGISASQGIPTISLGHDFRSDTTDGFLSVSVDLAGGASLSDAFSELAGAASSRNTELIAHRAATFEAYLDLLRTRVPDGLTAVDYGEGGRVVFREGAPPEVVSPQVVSSLIHDAASFAAELTAARSSNDELRRVLDEVEASKAEMAVELDAARQAVSSMEATRAARRSWGQRIRSRLGGS